MPQWKSSLWLSLSPRNLSVRYIYTSYSIYQHYTDPLTFCDFSSVWYHSSSETILTGEVTLFSFCRYQKCLSVSILLSTGRILWTWRRVARQPWECLSALKRGLCSTALELPIWVKSYGRAATLSSGMDSIGSEDKSWGQCVIHAFTEWFSKNPSSVLVAS